ncbi:MAG: VOC family protein [Ignavibacteria bacterium]|nr:VOC family protein [Ignavibacteria bacterium]
MTTINTYLSFNGNCEEAFNFYKSVFGGEFAHIAKFKDMPENPKFPVAESDKEKVMHISFPISKESILMGSDTGGEWAAKFKQGNNFSISINADNKVEADRLFNDLSQGGQIIMPMNKTFWDSYFGMFTDKFGIQWMVSFDDASRNK